MESNADQDLVLCFGPFRLDAAAASLTRDGKLIGLQPREFDLLRHLVSHPGRLVTKEQLLDQVWGRRALTEAVIKTAINKVRLGLGDDAKRPRYVQTVAKRGYRFVLPVVRLGEGGTLHSEHSRSAFNEARTLPPMPATELVGREREQDSLMALLAREPRVSVVGPAGVGKTHLALATARRLLPAYADGVAWLDLSSLPAVQDGGVALRAAMVTALRLVPGAARDNHAVAQALEGAHLLLVVDGAEHLAQPLADVLVTLSPSVGGVQWLVTSQQALQVAGEHVLHLHPLDPPAMEDAAEAAAFSSNGAAKLLTQRIAARMPGFEPTMAQRRTLCAICHQLEGLPLALELAAARVPLLGLAGLLDALRAHAAPLDLLRHNRRDAPPRQHSLRDALEWSHALLTPTEQQAFRRLGALPAPFTCALGLAVLAEPGTAGSVAADAIASLVDKSLLLLDPACDPPTLRMLDSARHLARERLRAAGEEGATIRRLASTLLAEVRALAGRRMSLPEHVFGEQAALWVPHLRVSLSVLRETSGAAVRSVSDVRLVVGLGAWGAPLLHAAGAVSEAVSAVDVAVDLLACGVAVEHELHARLSQSVAALAAASAIEPRRGFVAASEAVERWRSLGDRDGEYASLCLQTALAQLCADSAFHSRSAVTRMHQLHNPGDLLRGRSLRVAVARQRMQQGDWLGFRDAMRSECDLLARLGDYQTQWLMVANLAVGLLLLDDVEEAMRVTAQAVLGMQRLGRARESWQLHTVHALARVVAALHTPGLAAEALDTFASALALQEAAGADWRSREYGCAVCLLRGDVEGAALLRGWAEVTPARCGSPLGALSAKVREKVNERLARLLTTQDLDRLLAAGRALGDARALALVSTLPSATGSPPTSADQA
jgi:predicted ATPase/DNA-binding winged helix-turn-helix (wHTH) protein